MCSTLTRESIPNAENKHISKTFDEEKKKDARTAVPKGRNSTKGTQQYQVRHAEQYRWSNESDLKGVYRITYAA